MASYQGSPFEAGVGPTDSDIVLFAACPPPEDLGFEPATGHWRKQLPMQDVQAVWESMPVGMFRGARCMVLDDLGDRLHICYLGHDGYQAEQLGYWQVDRGVYELVAPRTEVGEIVEERTEYPRRSDVPLGTAPASQAVPEHSSAGGASDFSGYPPAESSGYLSSTPGSSPGYLPSGPIGYRTGPESGGYFWPADPDATRLPPGSGPDQRPAGASSFGEAVRNSGSFAQPTDNSGSFARPAYQPVPAEVGGVTLPAAAEAPLPLEAEAMRAASQARRPRQTAAQRRAAAAVIAPPTSPVPAAPAAGSPAAPSSAPASSASASPTTASPVVASPAMASSGAASSGAASSGAANPAPAATSHSGLEPAGEAVPQPVMAGVASAPVSVATAASAGAAAAEQAVAMSAGPALISTAPASGPASLVTAPAPGGPASVDAMPAESGPYRSELGRSAQAAPARPRDEPPMAQQAASTQLLAGSAPARTDSPRQPVAAMGRPTAEDTRQPAATEGQTAHAPSVSRPRRSARRRLATERLFAELASLAAIPVDSYAVGEEVEGALCLLQTDRGFEVFHSADGNRHELQFFTSEESACFYLFGVLAAEAVRNGSLVPQAGQPPFARTIR